MDIPRAIWTDITLIGAIAAKTISRVAFLPIRLAMIALRFFFVFIICLFLSLLVYGALYSYSIPKIQHRESIYFDYDKEKPSAHALFKPQDLERWRYEGEELGEEHVGVLRQGQYYDVILYFDMQYRSWDDRSIMVEVEIMDTEEVVVARSKRPDIEATRVSLHMMEDFVELEEKPLAQCKVLLSRNEIDVHNAELVIRAHLTGIQLITRNLGESIGDGGIKEIYTDVEEAQLWGGDRTGRVVLIEDGHSSESEGESEEEGESEDDQVEREQSETEKTESEKKYD